MKNLAWLALLLFALAVRSAGGAAVDDIANVLADQAGKVITADSLPTDFGRLAHFVRHDANGFIMYSDGGAADGHVRKAQARFDARPGPRNPTDKSPLLVVAFELVDQPDFTFAGLAAALERRLGTPDASSTQTGAVFRTWHLKSPPGRVLTIARAQSSDNDESICVVQLVQNP